MSAVPGPAMGKGSGFDGFGSGSVSLVPGDESGIELNHGRVPGIYKVAKRSAGHLISKWLLVVWEDAKQQGCY